jgi:hypothetical protein
MNIPVVLAKEPAFKAPLVAIPAVETTGVNVLALAVVIKPDDAVPPKPAVPPKVLIKLMYPGTDTPATAMVDPDDLAM